MESFILYTSQYKSIQSLSKTDKGELLEALYAYAMTDGCVNPKFTHPQTEMAYNFITTRIGENHDKYQLISEKRRAAGRKGGRPKKYSKDEAQTKETKAKKANGFSEKAKKQKKLTDTDTESRSISINPDTSSDTLSEVAVATSLKKQKTKKTRADGFDEIDFSAEKKTQQDWEKWYTGLLRLFNEALKTYSSSIKPVRLLSEQRRTALKLLWSQYHYTVGDFKQAFRNMAMSNYCNGRTSDRKRPVDFDFLIQEKNFNRAYEGSL